MVVSNSLTGAIPPELGNLSSLQGLYLSNNGLTGAIPPELGRLSTLRQLWLDHNYLEGQVPGELGLLSSLEWLQLRGNALTGCLPPDLRAVSRHDLDRLELPDCPAPGDAGTGLAPTPPGALPIAVNVFAVLATVLALLGIAAGFRTRYRP